MILMLKYYLESEINKIPKSQIFEKMHDKIQSKKNVKFGKIKLLVKSINSQKISKDWY